MKRLVVAAAGAAVLAAAGPAYAGVYGDDLTKCLVASTTAQDRVVLVQWMFVLLSNHPALRSLVTIPTAKRDEVNAQIGAEFGRLMFETCRSQLVDALKYEGDPSLTTAFQAWGQVAARDLLGDPAVAKAAQDTFKDLDPKFKALEGAGSSLQ